ncbi:hypothetical protein DV515_00001890 [Chloebia gouldiae]|uniref:Uncharacterized protein n=1 Tax=Chloebia gouldiae TaxID=44316 RepID=A0A3L8SWY7_CHLGU|nr:hypothetical protein DV515_00001890 [Chloebia gouldiae]
MLSALCISHMQSWGLENLLDDHKDTKVYLTLARQPCKVQIASFLKRRGRRLHGTRDLVQAKHKCSLHSHVELQLPWKIMERMFVCMA